MSYSADDEDSGDAGEVNATENGGSNLLACRTEPDSAPEYDNCECRTDPEPPVCSSFRPGDDRSLHVMAMGLLAPPHLEYLLGSPRVDYVIFPEHGRRRIRTACPLVLDGLKDHLAFVVR